MNSQFFDHRNEIQSSKQFRLSRFNFSMCLLATVPVCPCHPFKFQHEPTNSQEKNKINLDKIVIQNNNDAISLFSFVSLLPKIEQR